MENVLAKQLNLDTDDALFSLGSEADRPYSSTISNVNDASWGFDIMEDDEPDSFLNYRDKLILTGFRTPVGEVVAGVPFTKGLGLAKVHWVELETGLSCVVCNGPGCVLCRIKKSKQDRILWPLYNPISGDIEVLSFPKCAYPGSIYPQVKDILKRPELPELLIIEQTKKSHYTISSRGPRPGQDLGKSVIERFLDDHRQSPIPLDQIFRHIPNDELEFDSKVQRALEIFGD